MISTDKIISISSDFEFNDACIEVFNHQYKNIDIYRNYVDLIHINPNKIYHYSEIPFLPIQFFKNYKIIQEKSSSEITFQSSGTTSNNRSKHFIHSLRVYEKSILKGFQHQFGNPDDYVFLGLLPSYLENGDSSLVYMVDYLMKYSNKPENGFYLYDFEKLNKTLIQLEQKKKKVILFGVSYALLDFSEKYKFSLKSTKVIETGGMKGRKKEMIKIDLLNQLKQNFNTNEIYSEYGMTELLSQSYSNQKGMYSSPNWKKILIRSLDNPFEIIKNNKQGGINVIDLANIHSCSFIETQDIGKRTENGFEILGRMDYSDIRGCSLLYSE